MKDRIRARARQRLDERLEPLHPIQRFTPPPKGWIRAIRDALGMSGKQLSVRLGSTPQSVHELERSEARGTIRLDSLRKVAEALGCTLVYAIVPNTSLQRAVRERAERVARREVERISRSMALEDQDVGRVDLDSRIEEYIATQLRHHDVWSED
jgi:predicted DNA-binding mobile mystery protein A